MLEKFLPRTEFSSYEDFIENYKVNIPENFNFAYDVMDEWAAQCPEDPALHWCNEENCDRILSFAEIKRLSDKTANALKEMGIRKGDRVMLILMQRVEVWTTMLALQKIGAVTIPVTFLLTPKDIIYRCNAAKVKMIVSVDMPEVVQHIQDSLAQCETVENVCIVGERVAGFVDYRAKVEEASELWVRPVGAEATAISDPMLIYFSSGTTGMPKMILHDFSHPLGHIVTARYWQDT
ncbi:MAG: AMP-binding protein, partial [Clostridiales bacterium]|nr:AMP-binding protein [Clostridiales bacterium]